MQTAHRRLFTLSLHDALPISGATPRTSTPARSTKATTGWEAPHESAGPPQGRIPQCAHEGIPVSTQPGDSVASVLTPADRKSTRLNSSHVETSYAVFCLKKKK